MTTRETFEQLYFEHITRPGAKEFFEYLIERTDFFTAPASTRFHLSCEGGLAEHSLNVAKLLMEDEEESKESLAICGLLHDVCKVNFYKVSSRNVKNPDTGKWEAVPYYTVEDTFPMGHGEKSVYLIERFMRLKPAEAVAIRWHMGAFDDAVRGGSFTLSHAFAKYPIAVKLHIADLKSSYLVEGYQG